MRIDVLKKIADECDYKIVDQQINITLERKNKPFDKTIRLLKTPRQGLYNDLRDEVLDDRDRKMLEAVKEFCEDEE